MHRYCKNKPTVMQPRLWPPVSSNKTIQSSAGLRSSLKSYAQIQSRELRHMSVSRDPSKLMNHLASGRRIKLKFSMDFSDTGEVNSLAVQTRGVHKFYGYGRNANHVLRGIDLDAPYGTIYSLLGASGCGKTTLLRCILGRLPVHTGCVLTLGRVPGSKKHDVPGKDVGYMPQEEALMSDFTMLEMMYYFGLLYHMSMQYTKKRAEFLKEFLNIPSIDRKCSLMSGGQRRRVSFALAMLHEPPLLILDEPTIGVDPMLRSKIWQHLLEITSSGNTTIVLTTHYIEEARQAHVVGLMRSGKLLAQAKPDDLIRAFNVITLEDVFLKLSEEEELVSQRNASKVATNIKYPGADPREASPLMHNKPTEEDTVKPPLFYSMPKIGVIRFPRFYTILALLLKQMLKFVRAPLIMFLIVISPMLQMAVFCLAYGREIEDLKFYYTNLDLPPAEGLGDFNFTFGDRFIEYIDDDVIDLESTSDPDEGIKKVQDGLAFGFFKIPANFSSNYLMRELLTCNQVLEPVNNFDDSFLINSTIAVTMDISNQQIFYTVNRTLNKAFELLIRDIEIHEDDREFRLDRRPLIDIAKYVYGNADVKFDDTVYTAMFGSIIITIAAILTVTQLITERKEGIADRTWVAGVNSLEVLLSQIISFFLLLCFQTAVMVFTITYTFDLPRKGNIGLVYLIIVLEGMVGVMFGLMVSSFLNSTSSALQLSFGVFYPVILVSGVLWPLQSLPKWLQIISKCLPIALPSEATRSIHIRGWGFDDDVVWLSVVVLVLWIIVLLILTGVGLLIRN